MPARRIHWFLFTVVLCFGIWMRFHALDRQSLWDDEVSTLRTFSTPYSQWLHRFRTYEVHPPLYFLELRAWRAVAGSSLVRLRANSAFWGSLSLLLIYIVASLYGGNTLGFLTMALLVVSPLHLAYSQEARPYAFAVALSIAALIVLEKTVDRRSYSEKGYLFDIRYPVFLCFLWTCLLYTHYWGTFVVASQALYGWRKADSAAMRRAVAGSLAMAAGLFALWLPVLWVQIDVARQLVFWVPRFSVLNLFKPLAAFSGLYFPMASYAFYLPTRLGIILIFGLLFAAALIAGFRKGPVAAIYWLGAGLAIPWALSLWNHNMYVWYRYPILMLPAFVLLVAAGLMEFKPGSLRGLAIGACLASQLWGCWFYFVRWQKANPKSVIQYIHRIEQPDSVVVRPVYFTDLFNFYDQGMTRAVDQHLLDSPQNRAMLRGKDILLVAFDIPSDPITEALCSEFQVVSSRSFPGFDHLGITVYRLK